MKITEEQLDEAVKAYRKTAEFSLPHKKCVEAAIATLPEPVVMLRPMAEFDNPRPLNSFREFFKPQGDNARACEYADAIWFIDFLLPTPEDEERAKFEAWWQSPKRKENQGQGSKEDCFLAWQAGRAAK